MTTDEAQEAAWREWYRIAKHQPFLENVETGFNAGWNARGQHDKEQIAALEQAARMWLVHTGPHYTEDGLPNRVRRALGEEPFPVCECWSCSDKREGAGQSEEATE